MNQPPRFKDILGREGTFMRAASEECAPAGAMARIARQLGLEAPVLAAAVTAVSAPTAAKASGLTAGTAAKLPASGLAIALTKGGVAGLGIGLVLFAGVQLMPSATPSDSSRATPSASARTMAVAPANGAAVDSDALYRDLPLVPSPKVRNPSDSSAIRIGPSSPREQASADPVDPSSKAAIESNGRPPNGARPALSQKSEGNTHLTALSAVGSASATESAPSVDVRLAREVASLDRIRALAGGGSTANALAELEEFERRIGFQILQREAMLVRIDLLHALGRTDAARSVAHRLLGTSASGERTRLEDLLRRKGVSL